MLVKEPDGNLPHLIEVVVVSQQFDGGLPPAIPSLIVDLPLSQRGNQGLEKNQELPFGKNRFPFAPNFGGSQRTGKN